MQNFIIVAVIIVIIAVGLSPTLKHLKGQGGCCGGNSYKPRKKKLKKVIYRKKFIIDGMHCEHCKNRVEEVVNDIKGAAGKVNLKNGELTVSYAEQIDDELIKSRVEKAGYIVIDVIEIK